MSEVLKEEYAYLEMQNIARLTRRSVSDLSSLEATVINELYDTTEVSRAYGYADFMKVITSFHYYKQPRQ